MADTNISFATIVATPTLTSWSQAYNAGRLFAVLSLAKEVPTEQDDSLLGPLGKDILGALEEEYFTLEEKNLSTIRQAIHTVSERIPSDVTISLIVASIVQNVLYVFILGKGRAVLKRGEKLGSILTSLDVDEKTILSASGFLQDTDIIVLETEQFAKHIALDTLKEALDHNTPSEIAETLSPLVHEHSHGGASAIVLSYKDAEETVLPEIASNQGEDEKQQETSTSLQTPPSQRLFFLTEVKNILYMFRLPARFLVPSVRKPKIIFLVLAFTIVVILGILIFLTIKTKQDAKTKALFEDITTHASKKYEEGNSLLGLNRNLARDDFQEAKKILEEGKTALKGKTKEEEVINTLLRKVDDALNSVSQVNAVDAKSVDEKSSTLLGFELKNPPANGQVLYLTQDSKTIYMLDQNSISSADKTSLKTKNIIKNNNDWSSPGGIGVYFGNIYVLDKKTNQILKYTTTDGGFVKTNYIGKDTTIDFSKAVSLTIDGSIYVLLQNGTIDKFTKGKQEQFTIASLDTKLANPSRIFTSADAKNLYVLDNGNSRIVVLGKDGAYQSQYQTHILKDAKDFDVVESDKKIFILSGSKIWQIDIK